MEDSNLRPSACKAESDSRFPQENGAAGSQRQQFRQQSRPIDPVVVELVARWASLPKAIRNAIAALLTSGETG